MNLYLISQDENRNYDTYDSAIVAAESEQAARWITPDDSPFERKFSTWCSSPEEVKVQLIGLAKEGTECGVILASFNAG